MQIKKRYLFVLPLLLGFIIAQAVIASSGPPGSSSNPVISKSYADKVFKPIKEQISSLKSEVAILKAAGDKQAQFTDVPSTYWAFSDIQYMTEKGIITGLGGQKFGPNNRARRCELAVMLVKALKLPTVGTETGFIDVPKGHWAGVQIAAAQKAGIISGFPGGKFKPEDYVTRGQMAMMLVKAFDLKRNNRADEFIDVPISYWAYDAIQRLVDNGISTGFEDKTFRPAVLVRRAEVAVFLAKALDPSRRK